MMNDNPALENTHVQSADKKLVFELIESMYAGIALMMQAQQKKLSPDVLDLAEKLETTHTKLTEELKMYASGQGWLIPAGELEKDIEVRQSMAKEDNNTYQQHWLAALRNRHETNIAKLENAKPTDPKLESMGKKGLSTLKDLLSDIVSVQESVA